MSVTISDYLIVMATLAGPILAVQAQKFLERRNEERAKKLAMFHTLMSTRALRAASFEHVQALNSIDLFFSRENKVDKPILDAWEAYRDHLNHYPIANESADIQHWDEKSSDLLVKLLQELGAHLGYKFNSTQIKRGIYHPRGHDEDISARIALRNLLIKLDGGEWNFPMAVREFPVSQAALDQQQNLNNALLATLNGQSPLKVKVDG